jgi:hypothetical protein
MTLQISSSGIDVLPRNMENGITSSGAEHLCVLVHGYVKPRLSFER